MQLLVAGLFLVLCCPLDGFSAEVELSSFIPKYYDIELNLALDNATQGGNIPGKVIIGGVKHDNSSTIILDGEYLTVDKASIKVTKLIGNESKLLKIGEVSQKEKKIVVNIAEEVRKGDELKIEIGYTTAIGSYGNGPYPETGFYGIKLEDGRNELAIVGLGFEGGSESSRAKTLFPCVDKVHLKASFQLSVIRPKKYHAVFTTPLQKSELYPTNTEWVMDEFKKTGLIASHDFTVAVYPSDFNYQEAFFGDERVVRVFHFSNSTRNVSSDAYVAAEILNFYDGYFNLTENRLVKQMNVFFLPRGGNFVYVRSGGIFVYYDEFINPVEIFAPAFSANYLGQHSESCFKHGIREYLELQVKNVLFGNKTFQIPPFPSASPEVDLNRETRSILMLEETVTSDTVRKGLNKLLDLSKNKTWTDEDFFEIMQAVSNEDKRETGGVPSFVKNMLKSLCKSWGYPVILTEQVNSSHLSFHQQSLYRGKTEQFIPVKVISGDGHQFTVWMEGDGAPKTVQYSDNSTWILAVKDYDLYHVVYHASVFQSLEAQLLSNFSVFSPEQRRKLISDYFSLGHSAFLFFGSVLNLTRYIDQERDYDIWSRFLSKDWKDPIVSHPEYSSLERYLNEKIDPVLEPMLENKAGENSTLDKLTSIFTKEGRNSLKKLLLENAAMLNSPLAVKLGKQVLNEWKLQGHEREINDQVFALMVGSSTETDFNVLYDQNKNWTSTDDKSDTLYTLLKSVNDPKLYSKLLQETLKPPQAFPFFPEFDGDARGIRQGIRDKKRSVLLSYFRDNVSHIPRDNMERILPFVGFTTQGQLDEVLELIQKNKEKFSKDFEERVSRRASESLNWMKHHGNDILDWVRSNYSPQI